MIGVKEKELDEVIELIRHGKHLVVFTGAGMSTESGLPDFRSEDGLWKGMYVEDIATPKAIETAYDKFHEFYSYRLNLLEVSTPHEGYRILKEWEDKGIVKGIITQNVDGFHRQIGQQRVLQLHGDIHTFRCHKCGNGASKNTFLNVKRCSMCQEGKLRPNIVLFGESLSREVLSQAEEEFVLADVVLVIGTSLSVAPANQLPRLTKGKIICINNESFINKVKGAIHLKGTAKDILIAINRRM